MSITTSEPKSPRFSLDWLSLGWLSLDSWAVTAAVLFIVLVVAGIFPRVPW
jgi:hypothetical protein